MAFLCLIFLDQSQIVVGKYKAKKTPQFLEKFCGR
jgi:hypothetical protein